MRLNGLLGSNLLSCGSFSHSLFSRSLFNGSLRGQNLLGQSGTGQRNLSQVTHRLGLGGFLSGLSRGCLYLLCLNVGCLSLCCGSLRNLDDLLTFELSGELLQVNVLNG